MGQKQKKKKKKRKNKNGNSPPTGGITSQVDNNDQVSQRFVEDLFTRGEAARPDESGKLPPGATHEILEESKTGPPKVKRRRFSTL